MELGRIEKILYGLISNHFGVPYDQIHQNSKFIDDFHADSLDLIETSMIIEYEFDVSIPDCDFCLLITVGDAIGYLSTKLA